MASGADKVQIIHNLKEANALLAKFISPPDKSARSTGYKLDRMIKLMAYLGNPQNTLRTIHVAGTSGKTSTSYYVAALLQSAGYQVGLTVSPHVDTVSERAQINSTPLPVIDYCRELRIFLTLVEKSKTEPSYFEVLVAFAFWLFAKRGVDFAVIETGLGGSLDATNVIDRDDKVCIITDIGLDHTEILGNTVTGVTEQKAGIIRQHNHVFMHKQDRLVMQVIERVCHAQRARLHTTKLTDNRMFTKVDLPLFQQRNLQLAWFVSSYILRQEKKRQLSTAQLSRAASVVVPARMEVTRYKGKILVLDGSHNEQKIGALVKSMRHAFGGKSIAILVSFGENKRSTVKSSLALLRQLSSFIILTSFDKGQDEFRSAINPTELASYCQETGFKSVQVASQPTIAFEKLLSRSEDILLVTGSYYMLNAIRPRIARRPRGSSSA